MVACMTNMQNFLGFRQRKYQFWSIIACMKNMQNFMGFRLKKTSVWNYSLNENYAEFSRFRLKKYQFGVWLLA